MSAQALYLRNNLRNEGATPTAFFSGPIFFCERSPLQPLVGRTLVVVHSALVPKAVSYGFSTRLHVRRQSNVTECGIIDLNAAGLRLSASLRGV